MVFKSQFGFSIFIAGFLILFLTTQLSAQEEDSISFAKSIGLDSKSRFYKNLSGKEEVKTNDEKLLELSVVKHYKGEEGILFSISKLEIKFSEVQKKINLQKARDLATWMSKKISDHQIIPNCTKNEKIRTQAKVGAGKLKQGTLISDRLFMRKSELFDDPVEIFGPTVKIVPYEYDETNIAYHLVEGFGIKCLPYRIRITDQYTERLMGDEALRNYKKDLTGKGFLHKEAKKIRF